MNKRLFQCFRALLFLSIFVSYVHAWQWSWWIQAPLDFVNEKLSTTPASIPTALTMEEIRLMRARDIRRILTRSHGYTADEVARMLDKVEMMEALAMEESKRRRRAQDTVFRSRVIKAVLTAVLGALVIFCWPLLVQGYEILYINFVVWTDRKRYEWNKCRERQSVAALIGVVLMLVVDLLQFWLTASIALSWIIRRSKYFFPLPQLHVQPGQLLGREVAASAVGGMKINIAPMLITWLLQFVHARVESWTGRALARALQAQRKAAREKETPEERAARREARKQERHERHPPPTSWMEPMEQKSSMYSNSMAGPSPQEESTFNVRSSAAHEEFLKVLDEAGGMGELD